MKSFINKLLIICLCLVFFTGCKAPVPSGTTYESTAYALDTVITITLYGCGSQKIADAAADLCDYYEAIFSAQDGKSTLAGLNSEKSLAITDEESKALCSLIKTGLEYQELTDGALNIMIEPLSTLWDFDNSTNVPEDEKIQSALAQIDAGSVQCTDTEITLEGGASLDLGAIAKGYIADRIKEYLVKNDVDSAVINLGGNILCIGDKPGGTDFKIGVLKPFSEDGEYLCGLNIDGKSVVTSGVYERYFYDNDVLYHHILDPATGYPAETGLLSVTIISEDSVVGDCLSTGCFVMGREKSTKLVDSLEGVYAIFVDENYNIYYSEGAADFVIAE